MPADFHLHSHYSDGTFNPLEIVKKAASIGLTALALTDHDTVDGWVEMRKHCQEAGITYVPGVELSTQHGAHEIHLLGYFPSVKLSVLPNSLLDFQNRRRNRAKEMILRLQESGVDWDVDEVFASIQCDAPGRPHVARALVHHGVVSNVSNAFRKYLRKDKPGWVPSQYPETRDLIKAVHADQGLAVLAHPGLGIPNEVLVDLASQGLDGVEVFHTSHKPSLVRKYLHYAKQLRLLVTGGSDCHGHIAGGPRMGKTHLPDEYASAFTEALQKKPQHKNVAA